MARNIGWNMVAALAMLGAGMEGVALEFACCAA